MEEVNQIRARRARFFEVSRFFYNIQKKTGVNK